MCDKCKIQSQAFKTGSKVWRCDSDQKLKSGLVISVKITSYLENSNMELSNDNYEKVLEQLYQDYKNYLNSRPDGLEDVKFMNFEEFLNFRIKKINKNWDYSDSIHNIYLDNLFKNLKSKVALMIILLMIVLCVFYIIYIS